MAGTIGVADGTGPLLLHDPSDLGGVLTGGTTTVGVTTSGTVSSSSISSIDLCRIGGRL